MAELSRRFKDRPIEPVETAMWWTEYVLRHGDTSHLRPKSIYQSWYTTRLLDVYGFILGLVLVAVFSLYKILCVILHLCRPSISSKAVQGKKKQQ